QGFRLAVVDTPPAITMAIQSVIAVAELIVIPTRPSPHDLRAVGATVDLCDRAGKPLIFVVNAATPKAKITYEAAVALSQHGTVAPVTVHHRTDFAASMIDGRTVMEIDPHGRSAKEITELWEYISDRLEKNFRRTVVAVRDEDHDAFGDDIEEHPRVHPTGLTPVASPVHSQQAEIADRLSVDGDDEEFDETAEPDDSPHDSEGQPEPLPIVAPVAAR